ncbi:MAG TPA: hypothetical protein DCG19_04725 [Cryomorphaceae bacterium]|nr:hypothetical protein [Owenweeksia sp.]MBF99990.1 hypothetical protein [Owenweeksia sp.]HAD96687.1 hypothetical protein [Cryomorphaceae bacterium]HCQ14854.1 hypothetical protein [Cryomorphaceae bacterium]|tara:strand:- start:10964 stop:11824 length:861 start_codon:yes stop_codon:yes gene_type:complete
MHCIRLVILVLFSFTAQAQVNIMISDETGSSFLLGVDGYLQNTEPVKKLIIEKLDTSKHLLNIHLIKGKDTLKLARPLHLPKNGNHQYVIMQNFEKQYQLRYRGTVASYPVGVISMSRQKILPWPTPKKPSIVTASTTQTKASEPTRKPQPPKPKPVVKKDTIATKSVVQKADTVKPKPTVSIDKLPVKNTDKAPASPPPFEVLITSLQQAEFEFVKLNQAKGYSDKHAMSVAEVREVFQYFQYDNTRLQFLHHAVEKIRDPENIKELEATLEYELSKEQFKKKYL